MEHFVTVACFHGSETSSVFCKVSAIFQVRGNCYDLLEYLVCAKLWKQDFCSSYSRHRPNPQKQSRRWEVSPHKAHGVWLRLCLPDENFFGFFCRIFYRPGIPQKAFTFFTLYAIWPIYTRPTLPGPDPVLLSCANSCVDRHRTTA